MILLRQGDAYLKLKEESKARQCYADALRLINEILEGNPENADRKCIKAMILSRSSDKSEQQQALNIIEELDSNGRLTPYTKKLIHYIEAVLAGDMPSPIYNKPLR